MPPKKKNTVGGSGHKKASRKSRNRIGVFDEATMTYAKINKVLGDNRVDVLLHDGQQRQVVIPGRYKKKVWFKPGDYACVLEDEIQWKVTESKEQSVVTKKFNTLDKTKGEDNGFVYENDFTESDSDDDNNEENNEKYKKMCKQSLNVVKNKEPDKDIDFDDI